MSEEEKSKKSFLKEWLEQLQQESWQLELLISGLALFGIWESQSILYRLDYYIQVEVVSSIRLFLKPLLWVLWSGWAVFLTNLLIHIILRGFWIGAIGLRYVSGDIDYDALKYSDTFTDFYKENVGDFDDYIEKLERASSIIFSFTFLLFFLLISVIMFFLGLVVFVQFVGFLNLPEGQSNMFMGILTLIYSVIVIVILIDFFTLGAFKKIKDKTVSRIFLYIYRFISIVTLSFISRPLLLNFMDNRYTRKLIFLAIPYTMIILFGRKMIYFEKYPLFPDLTDSRSPHKDSDQAIYWNHYDDLRYEHMITFARNIENPIKKKIRYASLHAYEIKQGEMIKLFIENREGDDQRMEEAFKRVTPLRNKDVSFKFWKKRTVADTLELSLIKQKAQELRIMRLSVRKKEYEGKMQSDKTIYDRYKNYTDSDIPNLSEEIGRNYNQQIDQIRNNKLKTIIDGILSFNVIRMNGNIINDRLDCQFYVHPNMHEKGLLCYINSDSLDIGKHILTLDKENCKNCDGTVSSFPFRIIK
ncbi:MAG: hypothetical protein V3V00_15000 [Saprospiraceae bacterium]